MKLNSFKEIFSIDHRSLRLYRVCFSVILIVDILSRLGHFEILYSNIGYFPNEVSSAKNSFFNFFHWFDSQYLVMSQFFMGIVSAIFFLLGIFPRINSIFIWYFYNSLMMRNPYVLHSAEDIIKVLCFWNMFLSFNLRSKKLFSFAGFATLVQVVFIYIALMLKRDVQAWFVNPSAMKVALESYGIVSRLGEWVGQFDFVCKVLSRVGYIFEIIVPISVFIPYRQKQIREYAPFLMILFHFSIYMLFDLFTFPFVGMLIWILFINDSFWISSIGKKLEKLLPPGEMEKEFKLKEVLIKIINPFKRVMIFYGLLMIMLSVPISNMMSPNIHIFLGMKPFRYFSEYTRINQTWIMFTPTASVMSAWQQIVAVKGGEEIDLLTGKKPVEDKPANVRKLYKHFMHWRYIWELSTGMMYDNRLFGHFFRYYCRQDSSITEIYFNNLSYSLYFYGPTTLTQKIKAYDCKKDKLLPDNLNP